MHRTDKIIILLLLALIVSAGGTAQVKSSAEIELFKCWSYPLNNSSARSVVVDGQAIYLETGGGRIEALSADGKKIWGSEFGGEIISNILAADTNLYVVTSAVADESAGAEAVLRGVSRETGITAWTQRSSPAEWYRIDGYKGSLLITSRDGSIRLIDKKDGETVWERKLAVPVAAQPVLLGEKLIVGTADKRVFTISLPAGQIENVRGVRYGISAVGVGPGEIYVGDERGNLTVFDNGVERPRWRFRSGGAISAILPVGDHLLAASHDNFLYFLDTYRGGMAWKRRLTGRSLFASNYETRYAMTSVLDGHSVAFVDLVTGKFAGQVPLAPDETLIAPAAVSGGLIYLLTDAALYSYSSTDCSKKTGGAGK